MAIYSLHHSAIGKTTHQAGTAGAHIAYVTRRRAAVAVLAARLPVAKPGAASEARAWFDGHEAKSRKNARVADRIMIALPIELDAEQRQALVADFAEALTDRRAPWLAAIHATGKDSANPHAHVVVVDRDPKTGKRVIGLSEKGSTDRLRALWEERANVALAAAGIAVRIDRRSLADQGIDRQAEIHVGPKAATRSTPAAEKSAGRPRSTKAAPVRSGEPKSSRRMSEEQTFGLRHHCWRQSRMTTPEPLPPKSFRPTREPQSLDQAPLQVSHGKRLLKEIATARRDVVATKADTETILGLLAPAEEENPVLAILEQILTTQRHLVARMERIEHKVDSLGKRLAIFERGSK